MNDYSVSINVFSEEPKSEDEIIDFYCKLKALIINNFNKSTINIYSNHKTSNDTTPDKKYKIGNIYKLTGHKGKEVIGLLVCMFPNHDKEESIHLAFKTAKFENPSTLESNMGYGSNENLVDVDGYMINIDSGYGQKWCNGEIYDYMWDEEPEKVELLKEVDKDIFNDFYKKYIFNK